MLKIVSIFLMLMSTQLFAKQYLIKWKHENKETNGLNKIDDFRVSFGSFSVIDTNEKHASELNLDPVIEYIEPNITFKTLKEVNDPKFGDQWGLKNTGWNSRRIIIPGKKGMDINAVNAWKITRGSKKVKIAVIDTGIDYNHRDLRNNIMINQAEKNGKPNVDDDGNGYVDDIYGYDFFNNDSDPMDGHGHGTHCAGVIGATHNDQGIAGVMGHVQILGVQFLGPDGSGTLAGAVKAIDYATQRGVHIMSNSWGARGKSQALEDAVKRAEEAGILFVAAAGNDRADNDSVPQIPANIPHSNVISVGAIDGRGKKAMFSNYGKNKVHIFAPGVNILSTVTGNQYKKMSGTSMACPHVAGVAGLLISQESKLSLAEIKAKLLYNTKPGSDLSDYSASGLVDSAAALQN